MRHPLLNEWLTVTAVEWRGTKYGYDRWELWGEFGPNHTPFKLTADPEHKRAIREAGHDVSAWPMRGKPRLELAQPVVVLAAWNKGLTFKEVEPVPQRAGVGD